jgi:hypothetical protein
MNPLINRIVAAAVRYDTGEVIVSARHFDRLMSEQIKSLGIDTKKHEQGFIDKFGNFHSREDAYKIAKFADQIIRDHHIEDKLFSEHLY